MNEVKRCAKIGDWVKVVKKHSLEGSVPDDVGSLDFTVGDIFQVKKIYNHRGIITFPYWLVFSEYVVLDGYLPLKIIGTAGEDLKAGDMLTADANGHYVKYKPEKRKWTDEQIKEARGVVYNLLTVTQQKAYTTTSVVCLPPNEVLDDEDIISREIRHTVAILLTENDGVWHEVKRNYAICSENDEWNDDIGRMVALAHLLEKPLPKWVK